MAEKDIIDLQIDSTIADMFQNQKADPVQTEVSAGDYVLDLVRAPLGGASDAIQGLVTLGALPIDYLFNTNLTKNIDNFFNKWTPDAKTGVGEVVQTLVQFGLPLGVASKVGSGMKILKGAQFRKLSDPDLVGTGAKAQELVKRAGYFGALGGVTDFAVSTSEQTTALDALGLTEKEDLDSLSGRERAVEVLKQKLKFGAEGAIIGGAIPLLPTAGTLGYKYGIKPVAKAIAPVAGGTLRAIDTTVFNPLSQMIAGKGTKSLASDIVNKAGGMLEAAYSKTGLPPVKDWKHFDPDVGSPTQRLLKKLDNFKTFFTSAGKVQFPELAEAQRRVEMGFSSETKRVKKIQDRIDEALKNIVTNYKVNIYDQTVGKVTKSKQYTNIMDNLHAEKSKIDDVIDAETPDQIKQALDKLHPSVRDDVKQLKEIQKEWNTRYSSLLDANPTEANKDFAQALKGSLNSYTRQKFAAFTNRSFQYQPLDSIDGKATINELKKIQRIDPEYRREVRAIADKLMEADPKLTADAAFEKALDENSMRLVNEIKKAAIVSGISPEQYIGRLGKILRTKEADAVSLLKPGESLPDAIKRFINVEKGQTAGKANYESSLVDTVMYQSKQFYSKNYFDSVADILKQKGALFNAEQALSRGGIKKLDYGYNPQKGLNRDVDVAATSDLFKGDNYTYGELADALIETKIRFDNFFELPFYKTIMSIKGGAQIAKTIFSPMTQIRNVSTASFFPLMSGLIGGRTSLGDAWKLVAEDIFTTAKTDIKALNDVLDDMVKRGVIDQNIQVNEMRGIINKARDGAISFESFMNNPTVKKLVDVYQGGDNIWKVYSDRFYQSALKQAFGDPKTTPDKVLQNVKEWYRTVAKEEFMPNSIYTGQAKTAEEALKDVSAYLVTNTIPTYSKVPLVIQNLRSLPLGNFIAFPAEIIRTTSNVLSLAARELTSTNPYIRQMGARRLIGASATLGGIGTIATKTAQYITGVDQEKLDSAKRSFVPVYEKNATLIPVSAPDRNGKFKYINFSYSNPYDSLVRPFNAVIGAVADGTLNNKNADDIVMSALFFDPLTKRPGALAEFFAPFMSESIGTERITDVTLRGGVTANGSVVYNPQDPIGVRINKSLNHIIGGLEPGAFTSARRVWEGATGTFTDAGTARNTLDEITALMSGIRVQEVKPLASMPFILSSYAKDKQNIGGKFSREAYNAANTPEQVLSAWKTYVMESYDSQTKMYQTYKDAKNLGVDEFELQTLIQDRLKNKTETSRLINGEFKVPNYSEERFKSLIRRVENEDPAAARRLERNFDRIKEAFDETKTDLAFSPLNKSPDSISDQIDRILAPLLPSIRRLPTRQPIINLGATSTDQGPASLPTGITGVQPNQTIITQQQPTLGQQFNLLPTQEKVDLLFGR